MNGSTLLSLLVFTITAVLSPFSLIAFGLVLATDRGPRNGLAFIFGWITTVMLIGVAISIVGDATTVTEDNTPGAWLLALEIALGIVILVAWVRRRVRPKEREQAIEAKPEPGWQRRIGTMGYPGAFVMGGAVQTWPVMIAAASEIMRAHLGAGSTLVWMLVFAVASTAGLVVLEVMAVRSPGSAVTRLNSMRGYIEQHRDSVLNWVYLVAGLWLVVRGAIGLVNR